MPYLKASRREALDAYADALIAHLKDSNFEAAYLGDFNYLFTRILLGTIKEINGPIRYFQAVAALGTLEAMKIEIYRRWISPYENKQMEINGDVKEFMEQEEAPVPIKDRGRLKD